MSHAWMPLYIADYLADTSHLGALESGAYLHLIMHYWQKGELPEDPQCLARIARMTPDEWAKHCSSIASFFKDGWKHSRIDAELAKAQEKYETRANAGRKGGNAKAMLHPKSSNAVAELYQPQSQSLKENPSKEMELVKVTIVDAHWPVLKTRWQKEHRKPLNLSEHWFPRKWLEEGSGTKAPSATVEPSRKTA